MIDSTLKPIPGYSRYLASTSAIIYDTKRCAVVSQVLTGIPQYFYVNLYNDLGKRVLRRVHYLTALAHIDNPDEHKYVDHINRDRFDNRVDNLRWVTFAQNLQNTKASIVDGGFSNFLRTHAPGYTQTQYCRLRKYILEGINFNEAWTSVFPFHQIPTTPNFYPNK